MLAVASDICPWCGCQGQFKYHGEYSKYLFDEVLRIFRIRCCCGHTHAVMPSFSVPGQSLGMVAVETYLKRREAGCSRRIAATGLSSEVDWFRTGRRLERALHRLKPIIKAVLPTEDVSSGSIGLALLATMAKTTEHILTTINHRCLAVGVPPLYFARIGGLRFGSNKTGRAISHNKVATRMGVMASNSS